ncbi:MAG: hypothetical protein ABIG61_01675 [Planctomycetota bacterium]
MQTKNNQKELSATIHILGGSNVKEIPLELKNFCRRAGIKYNNVYKTLCFDWNQASPLSISPGSAGSEESIDNDEFVQGAIPPGGNTLKEAEERGILWPVSSGFHLNPGAVSDDLGAGGKPPYGAVIASLNADSLNPQIRRLMQAVRDYLRQIELAKDGKKTFGTSRVSVCLTISTVGAMGTGSLHWFLTEGIPDSARQTNIEPKVTVNLILRGNFDTQNPQMARVNEYCILKFLQVVASGKYVNPRRRWIEPVRFENVYLYSNVNEYGNMTSLRQLLSHQGHAEFFRWCTPAGNLQQERGCDLSGIGFNRYGDPLCGMTHSVALITRDSQRAIRFCTLMTIGLFCMRLIAQGDKEKTINEAIAFARSENLLESEEDNQLTSELIHLKEMGGENAIHQARESLLDRVSDTWGFTKTIRLDEAISNFLNNELYSSYKPVMEQQAKDKYQHVCERITKIIEQKMMSSNDRLYECFQWLQHFLELLRQAREMIHQKTSQIQEFLIPHQMVLAEASEQLQQLQGQNFFVRLFSFMLIRRIRIDLQQSGMAAIAHELELLCCQVADDEILTPLIEFADKKLAWIASTIRKLSNISQHCNNTAHKLAREDTISRNPNGYELTTPEYLLKYFTGYIKGTGGEQRFCESLLSDFIKTYGSLEILTETAQVELLELFEKMISPVFEPVIQGTNVWDEFLRVFPDSHVQHEMVTQLIRHSKGRVCAEDGVNQQVPWVKTANVPHSSCVEPIRKLLEALDRKGGKWEVTIHSDIDTISIGQLRGSISLTPFLQRLNIPDNETGWKIIAEQAVDVVSALIVPPNPNDRQIKRVLVKAIAANLLTINDGQFYMQRSNSEPLCLGKDPAVIRQTLKTLWPDLVFVESTFARDAVIDENKILGQLEKLQQGSDDPRACLIDPESVNDCVKQTHIMLPRLRRMRIVALQEAGL